jgi:hypothetical protein
MPNYFDYISESATKYDEPEFIEEGVADSFNETIADMDLHCFQESLVVGAIIVGAIALIGLLIVVIKKIINGSSGSGGGMKKQAAKMEKVANDLSRKGVKEIRTGSAATQYINSTNFKSNEESAESSKPVAQTEKAKSNVVVIEEVLCDANKEFVDILDTSTENTTFMKAMQNIWRFAEGTIMYFEYAIAKKGGAAHKSAHMTDKWRNQTDENGYPKYEMAEDFKYEEIFKPLDLPLREMHTCLVRKNIISIDAIRETAEKIKSYLIPETKAELKRLETTERQLKRYGEDQNNTRAFQNKSQETKYRKNVADSNKFVANIETMNTRSIMWLEKCNGSARFVGVGA